MSLLLVVGGRSKASVLLDVTRKAIFSPRATSAVDNGRIRTATRTGLFFIISIILPWLRSNGVDREGIVVVYPCAKRFWAEAAAADLAVGDNPFQDG